MVVVMTRIGAALRRERRLDLADPPTEPPDHPGDHVVGADLEACLLDLDGQVPVAQMPGKPQQQERIGRRDLDEGLGRGMHLDPALPVFEHEAVAFMQHHRLRQIEQERLARVGIQAQPPPVAAS